MHLKLFFLNGFGYAADSLILLLQSVAAGQAALEFQPSFSKGLTVAAYTGMLVGALFWGLSAYYNYRPVAVVRVAIEQGGVYGEADWETI